MIVEWKPDAIHYEADQRHAELIITHLGLSSSKTKLVTSPGQKRSNEEDTMRRS